MRSRLWSHACLMWKDALWEWAKLMSNIMSLKQDSSNQVIIISISIHEPVYLKSSIHKEHNPLLISLLQVPPGQICRTATSTHCAWESAGKLHIGQYSWTLGLQLALNWTITIDLYKAESLNYKSGKTQIKLSPFGKDIVKHQDAFLF